VHFVVTTYIHSEGNNIENEMGRACRAYGVERCVQGLVGKPERTRPLGRPRRRWEDNIKMDLQEVACGDMHWIGLAQDSDKWGVLVNAVMKLRVP
jgi:hypothetical protein